MESREGMMNSGVTVIAPEAPSSYHVAPRTENSTPVAVAPPPALPSPASAGLIGTSEKKKRGRPRKYGGDGTNSKPLSPMPISSSAPGTAGNYLADKGSGGGGGRPYTSEKKHKPKVENLGILGFSKQILFAFVCLSTCEKRTECYIKEVAVKFHLNDVDSDNSDHVKETKQLLMLKSSAKE